MDEFAEIVGDFIGKSYDCRSFGKQPCYAKAHRRYTVVCPMCLTTGQYDFCVNHGGQIENPRNSLVLTAAIGCNHMVNGISQAYVFVVEPLLGGE